ncbi:LLM class flavin-dependent oxidoreductase [Sulfidibacter corallicola]|uniref:LLM class flavin-dependent oxidoreductase n=1 Tax=Sulfidibacter corallicola TaxID=2818388 RepID=A0A8A4TDT8_SULCO|nr:LLM class flavin-dependent oxidoreductase [Sulfidibacter corallicola]QTD47813.1 LLM class flavin-dependent oxidoreductase [Sulfidibacter corallicola]
MKYDVFFSICQTEVDGYTPNERQMLLNFFDQVRLADALGYSCAWIAETHLSCQVQKENKNPVIPDFKGEIGLNTDIFQMAHKIFAQTNQIEVGSAILNIQCNGGPIARAEALRTALLLHGLDPEEKRRLQIGFASGRFPFSNTPYGIFPRDAVERVAWKAVKGKVFREALEIFLRFVRGDIFSSADVSPKFLEREDFRSDEDWEAVLHAHGSHVTRIPLAPIWDFEKVGVIPFEAPLDLLWLTIGAHDAKTQDYANQFYPCGVFNLSITPSAQIEATHQRMINSFHPDGGPWKRNYMPRTVLVFVDNTPGISDAERDSRARAHANKALENYWKALQGTIDPERISQAVDNALVGCPASIRDQMQRRFHSEDRLMLWFDFNNHDNETVKRSMRWFMEDIASHLH